MMLWPIVAAAALAGAWGTASTGQTPIGGSPRCVAPAADKDFAWRSASVPDGQRDGPAAPLFKAVIDGDLDGLKRLLEQGQSPNQPLRPGGWSALMVAAQLNCDDAVKLLINHGSEVNYVADGDRRATALDIALTYGAPRGNLAIFYALLDQGADMTMKKSNGRDVVIHAAVIGQMELVNELLDRGYRGDLPQLLQTLEIILVDRETEPFRRKAIARVKGLLKAPKAEGKSGQETGARTPQ
ncbi:ankyrin repeat domain-containing protein [Phenylobacterium sp.]|uniref:ankyrin repeat domain-containing protein n=1 Tax=Phenylobacterium sp. TaxID=1871053 RepID=UPI003D289967